MRKQMDQIPQLKMPNSAPIFPPAHIFASDEELQFLLRCGAVCVAIGLDSSSLMRWGQYAALGVCVCVYVCVCMSVCICMCVYVCVCMYVCMRLFVCATS